MYCSECGCDRILLQNALNTLLQPEQPAQTEPELETPLAPQAEEPTRIMGAAPVQEEPTRIMGAPCREAEPQPEEPAAEQTRVMDAGMRAQFPAGHLMQLRTRHPCDACCSPPCTADISAAGACL